MTLFLLEMLVGTLLACASYLLGRRFGDYLEDKATVRRRRLGLPLPEEVMMARAKRWQRYRVWEKQALDAANSPRKGR